MKTPYKDIYTVLKLNRIVILAIIVFSFLSSTFSLWMAYSMNQKTLNSAFMVNTDGAVIPLKLVSQKEVLEVEALAHLELFHKYFYGISSSNYKTNLEKALWLGNSTVSSIYRQKKADGVYNRLIQYSLVQEVLSITSTLNLNEEPYSFRTTTVFEINRGTVVDRYELITTGNLVSVDRNFPRNTHGLLITDFFENSLRKIDHEN